MEGIYILAFIASVIFSIVLGYIFYCIIKMMKYTRHIDVIITKYATVAGFIKTTKCTYCSTEIPYIDELSVKCPNCDRKIETTNSEN